MKLQTPNFKDGIFGVWVFGIWDFIYAYSL